MIEFIPVIADKVSGKFFNQQYLPFILNLFSKYKDVLVDDYYPEDIMELISFLIDEINQLYPWFLVVCLDKKPVGVVWITHWHGNQDKNHSCQLHSYMDKKYWGKVTRDALNELLNILFNKMDVKRVQMEIPESNNKACAFAKRMGFTQEGIVRCATLKNDVPVNNVLFSKLKTEYENKLTN